MSQQTQTRLSAEQVCEKANEIYCLALNLREAMNVVYEKGDSENGLCGFVSLVWRGFDDIIELAATIRDDAKHRAEEAAKKPIGGSVIAPMTTVKRGTPKRKVVAK